MLLVEDSLVDNLPPRFTLKIRMLWILSVERDNTTSFLC